MPRSRKYLKLTDEQRLALYTIIAENYGKVPMDQLMDETDMSRSALQALAVTLRKKGVNVSRMSKFQKVPSVDRTIQALRGSRPDLFRQSSGNITTSLQAPGQQLTAPALGSHFRTR